MGIFDSIKSAFSKLFGNIQTIKYDDTAITTDIQNYPLSLGKNYEARLKTIVDNIHHVYNTANEKEFTIGIIGDFTVGKSTFVNAILGERIAPVSVNPCTAIITKIKYGKKPNAIVHYDDGREVQMTYEEFMNYSAFNLNDFKEREKYGEIKRFKGISYATIYAKSDFLKANNLCLVDTLGLSAHDSDNKKTIESIRDSIAVVYICEERGLTVHDTDFISTYLSPEKENFFLCINRIDLVRRSERKEISKLVKLKIDEVVKKLSKSNIEFPSSRIYQVSSLYQEFANGYTDNDDYRGDIDYQKESGFLQIMGDICDYVKTNANEARKQAIRKQLCESARHMEILMNLRKNEIDSMVSACKNQINDIEIRIQRLCKQIEYTNSLFENLKQNIAILLPNLYSHFTHNVNKEWDMEIHYLAYRFSFGVGDYLGLEKDIFALKLNVFKSMKDSRYAKLKSLAPVVNATIKHLQTILQPILDELSQQVKKMINDFEVKYSYETIFKKQTESLSIPFSIKTETPNVVIDAMYRAAAQAAIESTWVKNKTRKLKMLDAAKEEALKAMAQPFNQQINLSFQKVAKTLASCNTLAIEHETKEMYMLKSKLSKLNAEICSLERQWEKENFYFTRMKSLLSTPFAEIRP